MCSSKISIYLVLVVAVIVACSSSTEKKPIPEAAQKILEQAKQKQKQKNVAVINDSVPVPASEEGGKSEAEKAAVDARVNQSIVNTSDVELLTGKHLSIPKAGASESVRDDNIHDTHNDAIAILQSPVKAMAKFPRDRRNQVDWVKTLDEGLISPRADLQGIGEMLTMDMDILMKNTQFMPYVKFPHLQHTKWLACKNCHPKIFIPQEDANPISMNKVLRGEYCGVCHDKVAFSIFVCERCHSVPHEGSGPKWW